MIKQMTVRNFRALRDVTVDLEPFTVLIGPNDTGKSSFLEALYALAESTRSPIAQCFWTPWEKLSLVYRHQPQSKVSLIAKLENGEELTYQLVVSFSESGECSIENESADGTALRQNRKLTNVAAYYHNDGSNLSATDLPIAERVAGILHPATFAWWNPEDLASRSRLPPDRRLPFDPSGYGLASCLAEMKLEDEDQFAKLRRAFCTLFPSFDGIRIRRTIVHSINRDERFQKIMGSKGEGFGLFFAKKDGVEIPAGLASGGTLVVLAFLTLIHLRESRKLLLIEEPENGLHPSRLGDAIAMLRKVVEQQEDTQVVLTTHSPLLLNYADPNEVRVFVRNKENNNDIEVHNLAHVPDIKDRIKYMMLGDLVYNEGEQELVGEILDAHSHSGGRAD